MTKPLNKPETPTPFDPYDPAVIRGLAEAVGMGECIAFPNGLTIDKRPVTNHYHYQSQTTTTGSWHPSWWWNAVVPPNNAGPAPAGNI